MKRLKRKKKRVVTTEYEWLMGELLHLKEEFLQVNPDFAAELQELPLGDEAEEHVPADETAVSRFAMKWDLAPVDVERLVTAPYGSDRYVWDAGFGVLELSNHQSNLVVVGIDIRHDPSEIAEWVKDLILDVRLHRRHHEEDPARWKPLRAIDSTRKRTKETTFRDAPSTPPEATWNMTPRRITDFILECQEALRAWRLYEQDKKVREIRDELFPEARDISPDEAGEIEFDESLDSDSALRLTEQRLALARHMIHHEGYREILPLTGYRSQCEAIEQWRVSMSPPAEMPKQ